MSKNQGIKCIRKCLESVAKNTLLNLHYYSNDMQVVFKIYNKKCGCIVGETLTGNLIFIQLDGIYHISVAEHSPSLPSTNKKKVLKDNSCSQSLTNLIDESNTQSSEESQIKEKNLIKDKMSCDVNKNTIAKTRLKKNPKANKKRAANDHALSNSRTNLINESNTQSSEKPKNKENVLKKDKIIRDDNKDTTVKPCLEKIPKTYKKKAVNDHTLSNSITNSIDESNTQTSEISQNKENFLIKDKKSLDNNKDIIAKPRLKKNPKTNKKMDVNDNALSKSITNSIDESDTQTSEETQYAETKANSSLENLPEMQRNIDVEGDPNYKINSYLIKNLQISNINGNSKIEDSGNFNRN